MPEPLRFSPHYHEFKRLEELKTKIQALLTEYNAHLYRDQITEELMLSHNEVEIVFHNPPDKGTGR